MCACVQSGDEGGVTYGLGISLVCGPGGVCIATVTPDGALDRGVRSGDVITAVNCESVEGKVGCAPTPHAHTHTVTHTHTGALTHILVARAHTHTHGSVVLMSMSSFCVSCVCAHPRGAECA